LREFVCPEIPSGPPQILSHVRAVYEADRPAAFDVDVLADAPGAAVTLHYRAAGAAGFETVLLPHQRGFRHHSELTAGRLPAGKWDYFVTAEVAGTIVRMPAGDGVQASASVAATEPVRLFDAGTDIPALTYTRIGDTVRRGIFKALPAEGADPAALRLMLPLSMDQTLDDYTASLVIKDRISDRRSHLARSGRIVVRARAASAAQFAWLTLVEADGTAWTHPLTLTPGWQELDLPLASWKIGQGVKLPLGYPERWNYWITPAAGRGAPGDHPNLANLERLQLSLRPVPRADSDPASTTDSSVDIATVELVFE
jgi:hypothetical protein